MIIIAIFIGWWLGNRDKLVLIQENEKIINDFNDQKIELDRKLTDIRLKLKEANLALNGLHTSIGQAGLAEHMGTDAGVCGRFAIAGGWAHAVYDYDPSNAAVRNTWSGAYSTIKDANLVLAKIEDSPLPEDVKGSTKAQALFYRAYNYLGLTTTFGDVPYWRDEIDMEEVALLGKTDANIIQTEMIEDLEWAISSGFTVVSVSFGTALMGRTRLVNLALGRKNVMPGTDKCQCLLHPAASNR